MPQEATGRRPGLSSTLQTTGEAPVETAEFLDWTLSQANLAEPSRLALHPDCPGRDLQPSDLTSFATPCAGYASARGGSTSSVPAGSRPGSPSAPGNCGRRRSCIQAK